MTFSSTFTRTAAINGVSVVDELSQKPIAAPGVYDAGLLCVMEPDLSQRIGSKWAWLLRPDVRPLAYTAFGDIVFWSASQGACYFIEVQRGQSTFIDRSVEHTFDEFLGIAGVQQNVLRKASAEAVSARIGEAKYGTCFIAEPWESLGGSGAIETYRAGDFEVFSGLVADAVKGAFDARRAPRH